MFFNRFKTNYVAGLALAGFTMVGLSGCSMCCGVYDYDYPTYGGLVQRTDPSHGRVGSVFSDPNAPAGIPAAQGVEATPEKAPERANPLDDPDLGIDDLEQLVPPKTDQLQEDADKPAEELKQDLLENMKTSAGLTPPNRMTVRPVRMLQQADQSENASPIRSGLPGRRIKNLFQ